MISTPTAFSPDAPIFSVLLSAAEPTVTLTLSLNSRVRSMTVDGAAHSFSGRSTTVTLNVPPAGRRVMIQVRSASDARNYEFNFVRE